MKIPRPIEANGIRKIAIDRTLFVKEGDVWKEEGVDKVVTHHKMVKKVRGLLRKTCRSLDEGLTVGLPFYKYRAWTSGDTLNLVKRRE